MKAGELFQCPHCGEESLVKKQALMDGFRKTGEILICALCQARVGEPAAPGADGGVEDRCRNLAALLGGDEREKTVLTADAGTRFCRDCRHFIAHPFLARCGLNGEPADPMADCPEFTARG
ncbi:MAG: hypothetical protein IJC73_07395 [Lentisphaeria bacterium]|nr:hypothetical protein [Lentisphaeria bacterium]